MSSSKPVYSFLRWCVWTLAAWGALAGTVFLLLHNMGDATVYEHWNLIYLLPSLAFICGWRALRTGAALGRWSRVIFWTPGSMLVALTAVLFQGQYENLTHEDDRHLLVMAAVVSLLVLALVLWREFRSGGFKGTGFAWALEIAGGTACMAAIAVSAYFAWMKCCVEPLRGKAEARWAQVGRPMADFKKTIHPVEENESLRELTHDLAPFGVVTFYKTGSGGGKITASNTLQVPGEIVDMLGSGQRMDAIQVSGKAAATLEMHRNDFDRLYSGILRREPPVWEMDITRGSYYSVFPNYLATRQLAQWVVVDAYHRLEQGDVKGAQDAVAAETKLIYNMGKQPVLISVMIHTAVKCLFTSITARLPADPDAMRQLVADVEDERRQYAIALQSEAWSVMKEFADPQLSHDGMKMFLSSAQPWPKWMERRMVPFYCRTFWQLQASKTWLAEADFVAISDHTAKLPDLGYQEMVDAQNRQQSIFTPNMLRAWLRLNGGLLVREQAEMIRGARAQMESGKSGKLGEYESVVIPGSKWVITGDAGTNTITTKLSPLPKWVAENEVTSDEFWLAPLDGSKPWQLRPAAEKVSSAF